MKALKVGDRVAFSVAFLRNTGQVTGGTAAQRGTIKSMEPLGQRALCTVEWESGSESRVLDSNLAKVGSLAFSEAV